MLKNYLISAIRSFAKHKVFTIINLVGLSLSMSVCLVLINFIYSQFQYDKFHPYGERTYRLTTQKVGESGLFSDTYATSPMPFGERLKESLAGVEHYTTLSRGLQGEVTSPDKILECDGVFGDEEFFNVFGFTLQEGDPFTALTQPNSIVLSKDFAEKLFPNQQSVGQLVEVQEKGSFRVTGVLNEFPGKSHMKFDAIASLSTIPSLVEKKMMDDPRKWNNIWQNYNYIVLKDDSYISAIKSNLNKIAGENMELADDHPGYNFELQGITKVIPGPVMSNEMGISMPWFVMVFFLILGIIVIITASINYTNLSIAKSIGRAKEVGVRKVNGAQRWQIVGQFMLESIFLAFVSLLGAIVIYKYLIVKFNELWIFSIIGVTAEENLVSYLFFFVFSILLGFITGMAPSLFLSKVDIITSLKGKVSARKYRKGLSRYVSGKKILTGVQFGFAILVLVSVFILRDQGQHLVSSNYGFNEDQVFFLDLQNNDPELVKSEFLTLPGVEKAALTSHHPGIGRSTGVSVKKTIEDDEGTVVYHFGVDEGYVDLMELELVAGDDFPNQVLGETEKFTILNEIAARKLGFENNEDAVGEILYFSDSTGVKVIGVVKDYHWEP